MEKLRGAGSRDCSGSCQSVIPIKSWGACEKKSQLRRGPARGQDATKELTKHPAMNCAKIHITRRHAEGSNALCELGPSLSTVDGDPPSSYRPHQRAPQASKAQNATPDRQIN
jgi:hypothetical protein